METASTPAAQPPRPRRTGRFLRWGLPALALLVGIVVVVALVLPSIAARFAGGWVGDAFAERFQGRMELGELDLSWTSRQTIEGVRLLDPAGAPVLTAKLYVPSLLDLIRGGGERLGRIEIEVSGDLVADDAGVTNLERALAPRESAPKEPYEPKGGEAPGDWRAQARAIEAEIVLVSPRLSWSDARTRAAGTPVALEGLAATAKLEQGARASLDLKGQVSAGVARPLSLAANVEHPFEPLDSALPPTAVVRASLDGFPTGFVDAIAGLQGRLARVLGPEIALAVDASGTAKAGSAKLELRGERGRLALDVALQDGVVRGTAERALDGSFAPDPALLDELLAGTLPAGVSVRRAADTPLTVSITGLELPLLALYGAPPQGGAEAVLAGTRLAFALELGDWRCVDARQADRPVELDLRKLRLSVALAPQSPLVVALAAGVAPGSDSGLRVEARLEHAEAVLAGKIPEPFQVSIETGTLPSALVDALAGAGGKLASLAGDTFAISATAQGTLDKGTVSASVRAPRANLAFAGEFDAGVLRGTGPGLEAQLQATPALVDAWLAGALPPGLSLKPASDAPLKLAITGLELPIAVLLAEPPQGGTEAALRATRLALALQLGDWRCIDARRSGQPLQVDVRGVGFDVSLAPQQPLGIVLAAYVGSGSTERLRVEAKLEHPEAALRGAIPEPFQVSVATGALPTALVDAFAGAGGQLVALAGDSIDVSAGAQGSLAKGSLSLKATAPRASVVFAGEFDAGVLRGQGLEVHVELPAEAVDELVGSHLPPGATLRAAGGSTRLALAVPVLVVPFQAILDAPAGAPLDLRKALAGADVAIEANLGDWTYADAELAEAKQALELRGLAFAAKLAEHGGRLPVQGTLHGTFGGDPQAPLDVQASAFDALEFPEMWTKQALGEVKLAVRAPRLPMAVLEAHAPGITQRLGENAGLDSSMSAVWKSAQPLTVDVSASVGAGAAGTKLTAGARIADPRAAAERGELPEIDADIELAGTELLTGFAPPEWRAALGELLGSQVSAKLACKSTAADAQALRADVKSAGLGLVLAGSVSERTFKMAGGEKLELSLALRKSLLEPLLAGKLPAGASLVLAKEGEPLVLRVEKVELPLDAWLAPEGEAKPTLAATVERARARLNFGVPDLVFTQAAAGPDQPATTARLSGLKLDGVGLEPGKIVDAHLTGKVEAVPPGSIDVRLSVDHPGGFMPDAPADLKPLVRIDGKVEALPTALIDALANQDGLLVDVLGPDIGVDVAGTWPSTPGDPLRADLKSKKADINVRAEFLDGVLVAKGDQGIDAALGLTPLFNKRIVGNLVPLMVDLQAPEGAKRAAIAARDFQLPLSGDLRQLSADVKLDLGELTYRFLPGIGDLFGGKTADAAKSLSLQPIALKIDKGVARYDSLVLPIGGRQLAFSGTFDLVDKKYKLDTKIPLSMLGKSIARDLQKAADFLDPETMVPIEIRGTSALPKLRISDAFLKQALEDAAGRALGKGLEDLFGKDKKDKDKKDGKKDGKKE